MWRARVARSVAARSVVVGFLVAALTMAGALAAVAEPAAPLAPAIVQQEHRSAVSVNWEPIAGADWYEVERDGGLVASPWTMLAYADPLVPPGGKADYRVRGVSESDGPGEWSAPVTATRPPIEFPDHLTPFEHKAGEYTTVPEQYDFVARMDSLSPRIEVDRIGTTVRDQPIQLLRIGYPAAPDARTIRTRPTLFVNCSVHGNERPSREGCLTFIRDLALSDDPALVSFLTEFAVIVNPAANPDGWAANTRQNADGVDVNRDYLRLNSPEVRAAVHTISRYQPDVMLDIHNCCGHGVSSAWSQSLAVDEHTRDASRGLVLDGVLAAAASIGYTNTTMEIGTEGHPGIARNYAGLRHTLGIVTEFRGEQTMPGRLEEAAGHPDATVNARLRAVAAVQLVLDATMTYFRDHRADIREAFDASTSAALANSGPTYLSGNEGMEVDDDAVIENGTCGYLLGRAQYGALRDVLDLHEIEAADAGEHAVFVPGGQRSRSAVALLLDHRSPWFDNPGIVLEDKRPTVMFGDSGSAVDSGVRNAAVGHGCTVADLVHATWWETPGELVAHVRTVVDRLVADQVLTRGEASMIIDAAARWRGSPPPLPGG